MRASPDDRGEGRRERAVEKRKSTRVSVEEYLSFSGIRFICSERVAPGSQVQLLIHEESVSVRMECTVVRSSLHGGRNGASPGAPVYEVGATFGSVDGETRERLERIMDLLRKAN